MRRRAARRDQRGAVTAELALGLPLLAVLTLCLAWMVSLGVAQVRVVDAARETARALARGEDEAHAVALGRKVAPTGSRFEVNRGDGVVRVRVRATAESFDLLGRLPTPRLTSTAVAAEEGP